MRTDWHRDWPAAQVFAVESVRVLYQPIAKCACTSLKRLMVDLSDIPARAAVLAGDVHHLTDTGGTGLILFDRTPAEVARVVAAPGWFRFAVVRGPFDRLVSAYIDKFVVNRHKPFFREVLEPLWLAAQGVDDARAVDFDRGISFRECVSAVTRLPRAGLDAHLRPQVDYLDAVGLDRLYAMEDLDLLAADLARHCGRAVDLPHANRTRARERPRLSGLADVPGCDLDETALRSDSAGFYDAALLAEVAQLYAADITLHRLAADAGAARRATGRASGAQDARPDVSQPTA